MENVSFQTQAHAKCILAGEHAVLRGCPALLLPVASKVFKLSYQADSHALKIVAKPPDQTIFLLALQQALSLLHKKIHDVHGTFFLNNTIQVGAGLGFSAALCVVISRWLIWGHWIKEKKLFSFAHQMENYFHGKSSGADIAGSLAESLVHFETSGVMHEIPMHWQPKLYLSYSGTGAETKNTISNIMLLHKEKPSRLKLIDKQMQESVFLIEHALTIDKEHGFPLLIFAIQKSQNCFKEWGLITPNLQKHMDDLSSKGAIAVKPTGSGGGGYVLSLWEDEPPKKNTLELIPLFTRL
ncbi:MAG: mevalonate kinase family protein [Legionella sp.]